MEELIPASIVEGKAQPTLTTNTKKEWYNESSAVKATVHRAKATDMTFFINDQYEKGTKIGWTHFIQKNGTVDPPLTTVGYMPIIQAPAHKFSKLNTVVQHCKYVANTLGQHYVVLTVDEALYCKLMELKWVNEDYQDFLIPRLGGLHTAMNFLKVIGKHIESSGMMDAWTESNILGPRAVEQVLAGKSYGRGMRVHKITLQAMWRLIMPQLLDHIEQDNPQFVQNIKKLADEGELEKLLSLIESHGFHDEMKHFVTSKDNANFSFWWSYMQMVHNVLLFIYMHFSQCYHSS